jgi:uncharacterized protein YigA (DUF484 family)
MRPARDVFTRSSELVSSVVVVPLVPAGGAAPLGALYYTSTSPCEFTNIQDTLLVRRPAATPVADCRRCAAP